jgi:mycothiol synthase
MDNSRDIKDLLGEQAGYTWRPARLEDASAIHALLVAADAADDRTAAGFLSDIERNFDDPWADPKLDSRLAFTADGQVAVNGWVYVNPQPEEEFRAYLSGDVHPAHRGKGLGEALFSWLQRRGVERLLAIPGEAKRVLRTSSPADLPDRISLFEKYGFQPVRYFFKMRRDLDQPIPELSLPAELTLSTYRADLDVDFAQAFNDSFRDHWGYEPVTYEEWQKFFIGREDFRPDLTFLALADGDTPNEQIVAGFSFNVVNPEANARSGIQEGWINVLGVRRLWRRRGIASALICVSLQAFKEDGLAYATLGVDTENLSGALGIYERLGFVQVRRFITYEKPVPKDGNGEEIHG